MLSSVDWGSVIKIGGGLVAGAGAVFVGSVKISRIQWLHRMLGHTITYPNQWDVQCSCGQTWEVEKQS